MRIEQSGRRGAPWLVFAQRGEFYSNAEDVLLGEVTPRGALRVTTHRFRGDQLRSARLRLDDARRVLVSGGHIRDRALERAIGVEASSGSFIVELDNGEQRRFYNLAPVLEAVPEGRYVLDTGENRRFQELPPGGRRSSAPRYDRPSASEWAEEALRSGRATHADLFRHTSSEDPRRDHIFYPRILPPRDGHPPLVVGEYEQLPLDSWSVRDGCSLSRRCERSRDVQRAYEAKKHAMDLLIQRILRPGPFAPKPMDVADAWEVATDAFEEARLPLQAKFARNNTEYWRG